MKILSGIVVSLLAHNGGKRNLDGRLSSCRCLRALMPSSYLLFSHSVHAASDKDQHHLRGFEVPPGPRMWVFGDTGLRVYSPDGKEVLKSLTANEVCHPVTGHRSDNDRLEEGNSLRCTFWAAVPDGKKYVWAAVARGVPKIDVFSLDTGDLVGSFETCNNVQRMEYHPLRDEIWVRCGAVSQSTESYMDVFSASSPSATIDTRVLVKENTTHSGWGHFAIDPSLGDVGYTTTWGEPYIYKVDLSAKNILSKIDAPAVWGVYDLAYSRVNQHMYLRTLVCCTCGFEGADKADCGRYGASKVDIISGPQA